MNRRWRTMGMVFALVAWMQPLMAWDAPGHELVAAMAWRQLNPKARQAVEQAAAEMQNPTQAYTPVTLACWMDDLRHDPAIPYYNEFSTWHYIDIPIDTRDPMPPLEPGGDTDLHGNVVQALKRAIAVLKGGTDPYVKSKAMACAMVMHLVGDIHQPLHCATKYFFTHGELHQDNGGNKEDVINGPAGDAHFNLHAFWDSAWRASFDPASGGVVIDPRYNERGVHNARNVDDAWLATKTFPPKLLAPDIDAWARESNAIARDFVYRDLTATGNRKYCRLGSAYVAKAHEIAQERIALAAARLAALLNATLGL